MEICNGFLSRATTFTLGQRILWTMPYTLLLISFRVMTSCDVIAMCTYGECAALPTGDVKVDDIVSRNDVGDTITILGYLGNA